MKQKTQSLTINKKGEMNKFFLIPIGLAVGILSLVVIALIFSAFQTTGVYCPSNYIYNSTSGGCNSATNVSNTAALTGAGNVNNDGITFLDSTTSQFGTAGTILGVSLLLLIIAGVGLAGYKGYQKYS